MPSRLNFPRWLQACLVWGLATLFYFYDNLLQVSPSAMKPELSLAFASTAEQFGSLSAYCLYAYGLMQIPAGLLMDRFGPKRVLTFACISCALGSLLFGLAQTLWEAKCGRLMIGVGAAFALVGCLKIAAHWFSTKRFALMTGLTITVGFLGAVFGLSTVSKIVETFGWRHSMQWGGIFGIALGLLLWCVIRDKPKEPRIEAANMDDDKPQTGREIWQGLGDILKHAQTWCAALYAGLMFVPTLAFGGLWGIPFLQEAHGFDRATAGMCISLIYVGWMVGSPFWGFISDYLGRRNPPMILGAVATLLNCLSVIYIEHLPLVVLGGFLFGLGFFSSNFILAFAVVKESNSPRSSGAAIGFTNALNTLWGALAQPIIGQLLDMSAATNSISTQQGAERIFSLGQYQDALMSLPIAIGVAVCLLFFLRETYCQGRIS